MASSTTRVLPTQRNMLVISDKVPEYATILKRRNLGQTALRPLSAPDSNDSREMFDYLHLRVPIPRGVVSGVFKSSASSYFLMRRSSDGFVSATGMFKAVFPWASAAEHENETKYVRELPGTSPDETAGNVWITPVQALRLAEEYNINIWVRALLDPARLTGNNVNHGIKLPPKFNLAEHEDQDEEEEESEKPKSQLEMDKPRLAPPTPPQSFHRPTRARRSVSPTKASRRKEAPPPSPRKRSSARIRAQSKEPKELREPSEEANVRDDVSVVSDIASTADPDEGTREPTPSLAPHDMPIATIEEEEVTTTVEVKTSSSVVADEDVHATVHVDEEIRVDATTGEEIKHTKLELEVPLPTAGVPMSEEEMKEMLEEARAMVESREESRDEEADETDEEPAQTLVKSKRKAELISKGDDEEDADGAHGELDGQEDQEEHRAKRTKTEAAVAIQVKKRRVRARALFGIGATFAVGALIPWAINFL